MHCSTVDLSEVDTGVLHGFIVLDELFPCWCKGATMMTIRREVFNKPKKYSSIRSSLKLYDDVSTRTRHPERPSNQSCPR